MTVFFIGFVLTMGLAGWLLYRQYKLIASTQAHSIDISKWNNTLVKLLAILSSAVALIPFLNIPIVTQLMDAVGLISSSLEEGYEKVMWFAEFAIALWSIFKVSDKSNVGAVIEGKYNSSTKGHSAGGDLMTYAENLK